jgi:hydroxysqualene dehydroxylase
VTLPSPADADAIVVGGGVAGLSCTTRLAELGRKVVLLEAHGRLGGRAASWVDPRVGAEIDNGPHLLAGAYRELFSFLERIGAEPRWRDPARLRVALWSALPRRRHVLAWRTAPGRLGLALGFARFGALSPGDAFRALSVIQAALAAESAADRPLDQWLTGLGQSAESKRWLWYPMARAVFNEEPSILSTRLFAIVVRRLFGEGPRAAALLRPAVGLSRLYVEPAADYLASHGAEVRTSWPVERVRGTTVEGREGAISARALCLAIPAEDAARVLGQERATAIPHLARAAGAEQAPLVTVHLWYEGSEPGLGESFAGFVDGEFAWAFDQGPVPGRSLRQLALVAPGSRSLADLASHRLVRLARQALEAHEPAFTTRALHDARVVKEPHAAPSLTPEAAGARPGVETPVPGLVLAGDWTDTSLPATLESAAWSGHRAAETLDRYLASLPAAC